MESRKARAQGSPGADVDCRGQPPGALSKAEDRERLGKWGRRKISALI